ncbi:MAG: acylphosphatase [Micrococcales bacterium]|nr:MAG: acylphosphatase [Micrococcales bacterium]
MDEHADADISSRAESKAGELARVTVFVRGHVQGVGFRWWTSAQARELGLDGRATNLDDGRVEVLAQGPRGAVAELVSRLQAQPPTHRRPGRVTGVTVHEAPPLDLPGGFSEY